MICSLKPRAIGLVWDRRTEEEGERERDSEVSERTQDSRSGAPTWEHGVVCSLSVEPMLRSRLSVREEAHRRIPQPYS